jgi:hypothetical protein
MCKTDTRSISGVELAHQQLDRRAMKAWTWMAVMGLGLASLQAMADGDETRKPVPQTTLSLRLTDEVISKAVRETLAEHPGSPKLQSGKALSGDAYRKFERGFSEAEKPGCLHPDAMKFQQAGTTIKTPDGGWNIGLGGLFALPFWAAAIVRGKCN